VKNTGQPFRAFLSDGFETERATMDDWETHLNTLFPEVRLKKTLEVRSGDAQSAALTPAIPAFWTGLLYDPVAFARACEITEDWAFDEIEELRRRAWATGLKTSFRGRPLHETAERLVSLAQEGLARRARLDACGRDERVHLAEVARLVERGMTPADRLLAGLSAREKTAGAWLDALDLLAAPLFLDPGEPRADLPIGFA
jgi:glutamate--cysteine ligase